MEREYKEKSWTDAPIRNFIFVGRMSMYKHSQSIPEALHSVYGKEGFSMTFIGKKEAAYLPTKEVCEQYGISDNVAFLGQINRNDIIDWYDKSDCFVMISDHEVFGLVYLEAMSRGCITIAGDNGGMVGIIEDGVNGFLCKPGDSEALADRIIEMFQKEELARQYSINAKRHAYRTHDGDVNYRHLLDIYEDICASTTAR